MPFEIECGRCGATNRVPSERLDEGPRCGNCKAPLEAKVPAAAAEAIEAMFRHVFASSSRPPPTPASPSDEPSVATASAIWCSLRHVGFDQSHAALGDRGKRLRAGLWGLLLGVAITTAGTIAGTSIMNAILGLFDVRGSVAVPDFVLAAAYAGALYGFMVTMTGTERLLGTILPATRAGVGRISRLLVLTVVGASLLIGVWAIVHRFGLADFSL